MAAVTHWRRGSTIGRSRSLPRRHPLCFQLRSPDLASPNSLSWPAYSRCSQRPSSAAGVSFLSSTDAPNLRGLLRRAHARYAAYPRHDVGGHQRLAQMVALRHVAAHAAETLERHFVLDAFGHDGETHVMREIDRRAHDHGIAGIARHPLDERLV